MDFDIVNGGSVFLLIPNTEAAEAWVAEHIPADAQTLGKGIAVEHNYIAEILHGIRGDGLTFA
jgi:hypothetical protein